MKRDIELIRLILLREELLVGAGNFRNDVNTNGSVNAGDIALVKANSGHTLP